MTQKKLCKILIIIVYTNIFISINIVYATNYPHTTQRGRCQPTFYYSFAKNSCLPCLCDQIGSISSDCDGKIGQCYCKTGYNGQKCTSCSAGYYKDIFKKTCVACNCSRDGSKSVECNRFGQCQCKPNITGKTCNRCVNSGLNFRKECTENCPEMYRPVAETFDKFDGEFNEIRSFVNGIGMEKNKMDELTAKINELKEDIEKADGSIGGDLLKLKDAVIKLRNRIRFYVKNAADLNRLQGITKKILRELSKIFGVVMGARKICADACNKAELYEEDRGGFLKELNRIRGGYSRASLKQNLLEDEAEILRKLAEVTGKEGGEIREKLTDLPSFPNGIMDGIYLEVENKRLHRIFQEIAKIEEDSGKIGELYEETKQLQEDSAALTIAVLDGYIEGYTIKVTNRIGNVIKNLQIYEDELKNISSLIQPPPGGNISTFQSEIENNFDKLQEIKIQAEKIIADDQLTKKTLAEIFTVVEEMQLAVWKNTEALEEATKKCKKEEAIFDEINAEIETKFKTVTKQMEEKTEALEKDLVEIETDIVRTEKEVESLEDILDKMETFISLHKEVAHLKEIKEELDKIPEHTCRNVSLV